jgi:hypothetical protein
MPRLNPRFRRVALRRVGAYYVGELGGGLYIVCDESMTCFLVEATNPGDAVEAIEDYLRGVSGEE